MPDDYFCLPEDAEDDTNVAEDLTNLNTNNDISHYPVITNHRCVEGQVVTYRTDKKTPTHKPTMRSYIMSDSGDEMNTLESGWWIISRTHIPSMRFGGLANNLGESTCTAVVVL